MGGRGGCPRRPGDFMAISRACRTGLLAIALVVSSGIAAGAATITLKVGYGAGGTYDLSSRMLAQFLGKYLPGNPDIVVQNVPGGGSLKLTKLMLGSEPADGSVIGSIGPAMAFAPVLDPENADFDSSSIVWLGSLSREPGFCITSKASGIDTMQKFLTSEFHIGASARNSATYQQAALALHGLGAKFDIVTGFDGVPEIELAIERGELAGHCSASANDLIKRGLADHFNIIGAFGTQASPEFPDVPRFSSLIADPTVKAAAEMIESIRDVNYPLMVPPGTPADTVETLRSAYSSATSDPEFIAAVAASGELKLEPTSGAEMSAIIAGHLGADPAVIEAARKLVE